MKYINLRIELTDDEAIRRIVWERNESSLPSNSKSLGQVAIAIITGIQENRPDLELQDILSEAGISKPNEN